MAVLHHVLTGERRDVVLLLIHPLGADLVFWDDFIRVVDGRATTLAIDLPGAGGSFGPAHPVTLEEQATAIEALRRELGIERFAVIACAVGAMTAATYAAAYPDVVALLVLANPTPASAPEARAMLAARADSVRQGGMAAVLPGAVERAFLELPHDERYERYMNRFAAQDPASYALALLAASEADAAHAFERVICPALLVPGRHDVLLPIARAEAILELTPHAQLVVMENAAHFVPYQQPERFAELTLGFIDREVDPA
jgi:3-oxoadipate enol-lactonase